MKLATITIAYQTNVDELRENISSYYYNTDVMILWDNSVPALDLKQITESFPQIVICQDGQNHGLPVAYNWAIMYAKRNGCTHVMTMDQDSKFERFSEYRSWIESNGHNGISAIVINNGYIGNDECSVINDSAQSGSIFPLSMIKDIGLFREDFFISMVDAEMCLRAQEKGYATIRFNRSNLIHHIGGERKVSFLGHSTTVSDYNALRHYYDSRNRILMWYEFPNDIDITGKMKHLIGRIKVMTKIVLFENDKIPKLWAILAGTWNGVLNRAKPYRLLR